MAGCQQSGKDLARESSVSTIVGQLATNLLRQGVVRSSSQDCDGVISIDSEQTVGVSESSRSYVDAGAS